MTTLVIIYWILGFLGAAYMLSSLFGGDSMEIDSDLDLDSDFDIDDTDDSPRVFSLRLLFGAFLGFAIGGGASHYNGWEVSHQILAGSLTAILFGWLAYMLAKMMYKMQGDSGITIEGLVGKEGIITIRTANTGKAMVKIGTLNGPQEFLCVPMDRRIKFKVGDPVKAVQKLGNELTVVRVKEETK